jgi:precorrin-3B methylase
LQNTLKTIKVGKLATVYAVGVGPGSSAYVTDIVKETIRNSDIIIGYNTR